ncbi:HigA family addiction module antitoxin [Alkalicaulis satelles]|uniref:HigA family addiction module antitoxin n=1 Tax=Alkalicaulis satelles TaxID=2609175 RepID=UPI001E5E6867|nr:HigA family addiction module antitoxin [Alkalicaulis satelles]
MSTITEPVRLRTHPGEVLREEFMKPLGVSRNRLSREAGLPLSAVSAIAAGRRAVTAETALRLARYFGTSAQFWVNLQGAHDLAAAEASVGGEIARHVRPLNAA